MNDNPLQPVVTHWLRQIDLALLAKKERFGRDADKAMKFLSGPYDWLYRADERNKFMGNDGVVIDPKFKMTLNKVAELVQLFGPSLYARNPQRTVTPRAVPNLPAAAFGAVSQDPNFQRYYDQVQAAGDEERVRDRVQALLLESYLNYTPTALDLKRESRMAIDEALIKGMSCLWTETYTSPGGTSKMVGSFYDSVDNLVIDPDMLSLRDAKWIARRCVLPTWEVERLYGYPPGTIRGNTLSLAGNTYSATDGATDFKRQQGQSNDLVVFWKVYSKMGVGGRLKGIDPDAAPGLEQFGDYALVVVSHDLPHPLNVRPELIDTPGAQQLVAQALQWETPFWADGGWPFTPVKFHDIPNDPWPLSHIAPGFGELEFLNWLYSFVAGKLATTCRDFIAYKKSLGEEAKAAIQSGDDLTIIELEENSPGTVAEVVSFLQHPQFNGDIWRVAEAMMELFEKRVGLIELMYGQSGSSFRSANESEVKSRQMNIRPDDMAQSVEDAMSDIARAEAIAARWHLTPDDLAPVLGPQGAEYWRQFIYTADPAEILHQLEYRVEAGSTRKPNRERESANMQAAMQNLFQPLFQVCTQVANFAPVNALIRAWGKTMDMDVQEMGIMFPDIPPPQPPAGPPQ